MSEDFDPEKTLEEYGYSRPGKGKTVAIVLLVILLLVAAGAAAYVGRLWSEEQSRKLELEQRMKAVTTRVSELENENSELSSLLADKEAEAERMREEWASQVETLKEQHKDQLQRTYAQMNEIVYDSRETLSYIGDIETRLREGQNIDQEEASRLTGVVNGLVFLHEQYKKPLNEFRELDRYFANQIAALPANAVDPKESTPLVKRIFKNREFKDERQEFFEDKGRRSALVQAKERVETAYAEAQRQMDGVSLDINEYLAELEEIIASNEQSAQEVEQFFEKSKKILEIHDRIMNIEPPKPSEVRP